MFHVELRQFPHNFCRFNLSDTQLRSTILEPWARGLPIELGERRWDPAQAKLTVLESPRLSPDQLTMGRGWRNAERNGHEVTDQLLNAVRMAGAATTTQTAKRRVQPDSLALEILADLACGRAPLYRVWELALEASGERPSGALSLAEAAVASLLRSNLVMLLMVEGGDETEPHRIDDTEQCESILKAPASWSMRGQATTVWISKT